MQAVRWQLKRRSPDDGEPSSSTEHPRPQIVVTLQDPAHEVAAETVLSAMYLLKPVPELLSGLSQEQQLQTALLADLWQLPAVSTAAVKLLVQRAGAQGDDGLSEAVSTHLQEMDAVPDCVLPLLKCVLLAKYRNLEAVWVDSALQAAILALPLHSMELLLSCSELGVRIRCRTLLCWHGGMRADIAACISGAGVEYGMVWLYQQYARIPVLSGATSTLCPISVLDKLYKTNLCFLCCTHTSSLGVQVASEDTVLFTAQAYINKISNSEQQQQAKQRLAKLIRCPVLSRFWLSASVLSAQAPQLLLSDFQPQLQQLLLLRQVASAQDLCTPGNGPLTLVPDAPPSWGLGPRTSREASCSLEWHLDVSVIRTAAESSMEANAPVELWCPRLSGPCHGIRWAATLKFAKKQGGGCRIGLFITPV